MPSVKLIALTQPLIKTEDSSRFLTPEELIVYCARVSNPNNQLNMETADKLLAYCIKHGHWSVFEQADMTVEITTSVPIATQIIRHRTGSAQQFSARYSQVQEMEPIELRHQATKNRQSSSDIIDDDVLSEALQNHMKACQSFYDFLIKEGVAKECARFALPQAASTTMYFKNNIRNWIHYIDLRTKEDTQKEHRLIAEDVKSLFIENFPMIAKAKGWV